MVATIMDILTAGEQQQQQRQAGLNPLTGLPYSRATGLNGMWDFMQDPLKPGTPMGGIAGDWNIQTAPHLLGGAEAQMAPHLLGGLGELGGQLGSIYEEPGSFPYRPNLPSYTPPGMGEGPMAGPGIELSDEAKRRYGHYASGGAAGTYGETPEGRSGDFQMGGLPGFIPAARYEGTEAPDFSAATRALGSAPAEPERRPLSERLGRTLGGAAGGAARAMRGTTGRASVAAALGGGAEGAGTALARISREEQTRNDRWRQMVQTHKARSAELQAKVASSKTAHAQREAMLEWQSLEGENQAKRAYEEKKAMQVHNIGKGIVVYQTWDEATGKFNMHTVDFLEGWREKDFMLKIAIANKRGETWIGGDTHVKVGPQMGRAIEEVVIALHSDEEFLQQVYDFMAEESGMDIEQFMSEVIEGHIDWENAMPMITFAALRLRGIQTRELEAMLGEEGSGTLAGPRRSESPSVGPLQILGLSPVGG